MPTWKIQMRVLLALALLGLSWSFQSRAKLRGGGSSLLLRAASSSPSSNPKKSASKLPNLQQAAFPDPADKYDLIVIGAGPGGESTAVRAAQLGARVAIIERKSAFGGPSGLTSKAVREATKRIVKAVDQIGGSRKRQIAGLWERKFPNLRTEAEVMQAKETRDRLTRNGVDLFVGTSTFVDTKGTSGLNIYDDAGTGSDDVTVRVCRPGICVDLLAEHVVVATGSRPHRPRLMSQRFAQKEEHREVAVPFKKGVVVDATEMGGLSKIPKKAAAVIGGGVIAVEYATVLAELGVGVSVICPDEAFMPFLDEELRYRLKRQMKKGHVLFVTEAIKEISLEEVTVANSCSTIARISLEPRVLSPSTSTATKGAADGRKLPERKLTVDMILYSGGRDANSEGMGLEQVGVDLGRYGRVLTDDNFLTTSKSNGGYSIYAIGDVAGGGLASTAMQQARILAEHLFGDDNSSSNNRLSQPIAADKSSSSSGDDEYDLDIDTAVDEFFIAPTTITTSDGNGNNQGPSTLFGDLRGGSAIDAPLTLWTIPEIASVGYTMEQAEATAPSKACRDSIVTGYAYFKDTARGRLTGGDESFLKVVAWKEKEGDNFHTLVGVHIMGEGANELIQTGSILIHAKVPLQQVSKTPFAAVTLSGLYQVACDDAIMTLRKRKEEGAASE